MPKLTTPLLLSAGAGIIVLFLTAYTLYLADSFTSTDKEVESLMQSQMNTILISVNQFTEDVVTNVYTRVNLIAVTQKNPETLYHHMQKIIKESGYIRDILWSPLPFDKIAGLQGPEYAAILPGMKFSDDNIAPLKKLYEYAETGYLKIENTVISKDSAAWFFLLENDLGGYTLWYLSVNPEQFATAYINNKLKDLAADQYEISLVHPKFGALLSGNHAADTLHKLSGPFRMLSGYEFIISPSGKTLASAISERSRFNLYLMIAVNLMLVAGIFVFWYILKREMKLAQLKTDFVANVSHELRTPLSLISMFSESLLLGRVKNEAKQKEYFSIIQSETGRLSGLVNRILNFSQLDAGRKKFVMEEFDLTEMLQKVYHTYEYHLAQKGFTSSLQIPDEEMLVHADKSAIEEVCINLIDNAMKYSAEIKEVKLSAEIKEEYAVFSITDKGVGISSEDQKHIFDKFFRAGSSLIHTTKGTGLGLSIVKQIIDVHQGKVEVISLPGKGSTFSVWLPLNTVK